MNQLDGLHTLLGGAAPQSSPQTQGAAEGVIRSVDVATHTATYTLPKSFGPESFFGPVPYSSTGVIPAVGDKCLVVFLGDGIDVAWIAGWAPSA